MLKFKIVKGVLILSNNTMQVLINETTKQVRYITNRNYTYMESQYLNRLDTLLRAIEILSHVENQPHSAVCEYMSSAVSSTLLAEHTAS